MGSITFLLVDGTDFYRHILRQLVQSQANWSILGEAANGQDTVHLAAIHTPDVVLIDVSLPVMNGIEATRRIKQAVPKTRVIIFSGYQDEEFRRESMLAGADYYLLKEDLDAKTLAKLIATLFP